MDLSFQLNEEKQHINHFYASSINQKIFLVLTGCECERGELVLVLEVHERGGVGHSEGEAGNGDQSGGPVGSALLRGSDPGDVDRIVFLVVRKLPQPSEVKAAVQGDGPVVLLIRNYDGEFYFLATMRR